VLLRCAIVDRAWCLEHACGRCGWVNFQSNYVHSAADRACIRTKQHDPKARQSCYGIHTEPCPRYHQVMFFLNMSHNCYPCILSNEQHEKRHIAVRHTSALPPETSFLGANGSLQIAELVSKYKRFEDAERLAVTPIGRGTKGRRSADDMAEPSATTTVTEDVEEMGEDEKSDSETNCSHINFPTTCKSSTTAQRRALKKEVKAEKSISKAAKNQRKNIVTVRREDIETVARAIHGHDYEVDRIRGTPLATDKTIDEVMKRNLGFVSGIQEHRSVLLKSLAKERDFTSKNKQPQRSEMEEVKPADPKAEMGDLVTAVLTKLEIPSVSPTLPLKSPATAGFATPGNGKRVKAAILQKLSAAIAEDIENHENELKQTYQRAAGFWRYANNEILVRLTEHARKIDWTTGERVRTDGSYEEDGTRNMIGKLGSGHAASAKSGSDGMTRVRKNRKTGVDWEGAENANMLGGLPYDAYSLSMLDYRSAEGIGQYFRRNEKFSDIPGHFLRPAK
jgi:hypothetical protein